MEPESSNISNERINSQNLKIKKGKKNKIVFQYYILKFCLVFCFELLFISLRDFLPSFNVLRTSQVRQEIIKKVRIAREIKVLLTKLSI